MLIYLVTNIVNGKMYIGQTVNSLRHRKKQHINDALSKQNNMYFGRAIRKYDPENFDWKILHDNITTIEDLNRLEIFYIGYYDTFGGGYNLTGGGGGSIGFKHSEETKKILSKIHTGKTLSTIHKKHIGDRLKGKGSYNYGKFGKDSPRAKKVKIDNYHFGSLIDAAEFIGKTPSSIRYRILHKTKWLDYSYIKEGNND